GRSARADHDRRNLAAAVGGRLVVAVLDRVTARPFVPGDEYGGGPGLVLLAVQDGRQVAGQPRVALRDGAVVHVIDQVRGDKRERGQGGARQVGGELGVGDIVAGAPGQLRVIDSGVMPHRVFAGIRLVAIGR